MAALKIEAEDCDGMQADYLDFSIFIKETGCHKYNTITR